MKFNSSELVIAIDSVGKMQELEQRGRTEINLGKMIDTMESIIAKKFYFELEALPIYRGGQYQCTGRIFYRFTGARQLALLTQLFQNSVHFLLGEILMTGVQVDGVHITRYSNQKLSSMSCVTADHHGGTQTTENRNRS